MCGIAGFWDSEKASEQLSHALEELAPRGQDAAGAWTNSDKQVRYANTPAGLPELRASTVAVGHTLHAMVGCLPQPLLDFHGGILSANCELYTWRARAEREGLRARNDAELLLLLLEQLETIDEHSVAQLVQSLEGTYAFAYERDGKVVAARDLFGVKPLWYSTEHGLVVASTRAALRAAGVMRIEELSPRSVLIFDRVTQTATVHRRAFLTVPTETEAPDTNVLVAELTGQIHTAIMERVPEHTEVPYALFLGGGVDSAVIATVLGVLPRERRPRCYTVARPGSREARAAAAIASVAGLELTVVKVTPAAVAEALPRVLAVTDDANPVKVSVGLVMALASAAAAKDGCLCAFSGVGVDEVFATLARHQASTDRMLEAIASLRKLHERELTRDDAIAMNAGVELRFPFLDEAFVRSALRTLPSALDSPAGEKRAFRVAAEELGVPAVIAELPRKAPQYGSGVMHALIVLSKRAHARSVADYIASLASHKPSVDSPSATHKRIGVLLSGGKDSVLAAHILHSMRYTLACAITIESDNPDSYLYHTPNTAAAALQAQAMRLPFITARTHGEPELELSALREALLRAKKDHAIAGVVTGAIGSQYQRERIEKLCDELSLTVFSPLWQMNQVAELQMLIAQRFEVIFTRVAAEGLDASWLGQRLTLDRIHALQQLHARNGVHPAGEGGEYESLVLDAPLFHERLQIGGTEVIKDGSAATLHVHGVTLVPKQFSIPLD